MNSKNKILIITSKKDIHADHIIDKCNSSYLGENIIRLNTEDFLTNCEVDFDGINFNIYIKDSGIKFSDSEVKSVWYRRPLDINVTDVDDKGVADFIKNQTSAFLSGFYFSLKDDALWVNPLSAMHHSRLKLPQLRLATQLGFNTPRVMVTNSFIKASEFFNSVGTVCNKSLDKPYYFRDSKYKSFLTKKIDNAKYIYDNLSSIEVCPTFFEEYIEKRYDIRVVIIKDKIFAFEIDSQSNPLSEVDFRGIDASEIEHRQHNLPDGIKNKIFSFLEKSNLIFSSMDLVLSKDNQYYFIENNCNGQWLWLECLAKVNISDTMIKLLFEHTT